MTISVVGNGAAAIAMVLRLVKDGHSNIKWYGGKTIEQDVRGMTIEGRPYGIAYRTDNPRHKLNAEAKAMSLFQDEQSFPSYLVYRRLADSHTEAANMFAPRAVYRQYLRSLLEAHWDQIEDGVTMMPPVWKLHHVNGFEQGERVILCLGATHRKSNHLPNRTIQNPWDFDYGRVHEAHKVLIVGSGLTALDTAISVWDMNPEVHIDFISRNGRFPLEWQPSTPLTYDQAMSFMTGSVRHNLRQLRAFVAQGGKWQDAFAAMRHEWKNVWRKLDMTERRRFMRLKPFWEIHRHRMIPATKALLNGRSWTLTKSKTDAAHYRDYSFVFNATGVDTNPMKNPLLKDMVEKRMIDLDGFNPRLYGEGLKADPSCKVGHRIWCVGAYMRWERWEATAMADIVDMVNVVAKQIERNGR